MIVEVDGEKIELKSGASPEYIDMAGLEKAMDIIQSVFCVNFLERWSEVMKPYLE